MRHRKFGWMGIVIVLGIGAVGAWGASKRKAEGGRKPPPGPRLDVVFLLDSTGSMKDEIDAVKGKIRDLVAQIAAGDPTPQVRFGMVAYRDRGDEYVTKRFPLTDDIDRIAADLATIVAEGGGDEPESLNEALHIALTEMKWDPDEDVSKLLFLIADAPPHLDYEEDYHYRDEVKFALKKGIIIHTIAGSGLSEEGVKIFQEIARGSEGRFEHLTYRQERVNADGEREVVLVSGDRAYQAREGTAWKAGADRAAAAGEAEEIGPAEVMAPRSTPAGAGKGPAGNAGPAGPAAERGKNRARGWENNLDALLLRMVQDSARKKGVVYAEDRGTVKIRKEFKGHYSGFKKACTQVVTDAETWRRLWQQGQANRRPVPAVPAVDFAREMVLVAALGEKRSGGFSIAITDIARRDREVVVTVQEQRPPKGAFTTMALTQPYHILIVERTDLPVRFVTKTGFIPRR